MKKIIWIFTISISLILGGIFNFQSLENPSTAGLTGSILGSTLAMLAMPLILTGITYFLEKLFRNKKSDIIPFENTFFGWWVVTTIFMTIGQYT